MISAIVPALNSLGMFVQLVFSSYHLQTTTDLIILYHSESMQNHSCDELIRTSSPAYPVQVWNLATFQYDYMSPLNLAMHSTSSRLLLISLCSNYTDGAAAVRFGVGLVERHDHDLHAAGRRPERCVDAGFPELRGCVRAIGVADPVQRRWRRVCAIFSHVH